MSMNNAFLLLALLSGAVARVVEVSGGEREAPFVSTLSPPFPHVSSRMNPERLRAYSVHVVTITFKNCRSRYRWRAEEYVSVECSAARTPYISASFSRSHTPPSGLRGLCVLQYSANVPFNLDGLPLLVTYSLRSKTKVVERSYMIKHLLADLQIAFDKNHYRDGDPLIVRCILNLPRSKFPIAGLNIIPPKDTFIEHSRRTVEAGLILEVSGNIQYRLHRNMFSCVFPGLRVNKSANILASLNQEQDSALVMRTYNTSYVALASCLALFVLILIVISCFTLIIGKKNRLSVDISAYYTESIEDRTIRFANPIINNLTSPLRKYRLPGILTAFQLRRNFKSLFASLLTNFSSITPKINEKNITSFVSKEENLTKDNEIRFVKGVDKEYDDKDTYKGVLRGKTAISLGPNPQLTPAKYLELISKQNDEALTLAALGSGNGEKVSVEDSGASDQSLDCHVISTLPYSRLYGEKEPHWSVLDTKIPIKTGLSQQARTFKSTDTI